jgi:hypothetical protein
MAPFKDVFSTRHFAIKSVPTPTIREMRPLDLMLPVVEAVTFDIILSKVDFRCRFANITQNFAAYFKIDILLYIIVTLPLVGIDAISYFKWFLFPRFHATSGSKSAVNVPVPTGKRYCFEMFSTQCISFMVKW